MFSVINQLPTPSWFYARGISAVVHIAFAIAGGVAMAQENQLVQEHKIGFDDGLGLSLDVALGLGAGLLGWHLVFGTLVYRSHRPANERSSETKGRKLRLGLLITSVLFVLIFIALEAMIAVGMLARSRYFLIEGQAIAATGVFASFSALSNVAVVVTDIMKMVQDSKNAAIKKAMEMGKYQNV